MMTIGRNGSVVVKKKSKLRKIIGFTVLGTATAFGVMSALAAIKKPASIYDDNPEEKNPMEGKKVVFVENDEDKENADGVKGHLEAVGISESRSGLYIGFFKRIIDIILSFGGLIVLSPIMRLISLAIKIDDPGPVLFTQKRIGKNKQYFKLHKFRSMKMSTPHDTPTHMLENPDQYITKVGNFLRAHSLDELPQIWDIFIGNMSVIGPRPALWNQDVLTAERDKYGANDIKPGLTGWAQINGRDELEIPDKAKLDGEYVKKQSLLFDAKCFFGTISKIGHDESVVEGGTGNMNKNMRVSVPKEDIKTPLGCDLDLLPNFNVPKRVLITGANSYIGTSFEKWATEKYPETFTIDTVDMRDDSWKEYDFSKYDTVFHVAGIAHADVGNVSEEIKEKYYKVNTDLAIETARKAKMSGVKQFIFMSSMIVYGESAPFGTDKLIDRDTIPSPANFYGDSKWQADKGVRALADAKFKVAVLRPPMIYGKDSKGNFPVLVKLAKLLPVFPNVNNQRSMLYIDNLSEFLCNLISTGEEGIYFPQNSEYTRTSDMVKKIAKISGKKIFMTKLLSPAVVIGSYIPGKIKELINKAFGNSCYDQKLSQYGFEYRKINLSESIKLTCSNKQKDKKHILLISQYFYPETFRVNDLAVEWVKKGHRVTVITGIPNYPMGKFFDGYDYVHRRKEKWKGVDIIRIPLIPRGNSSAGMIANYMSFLVSGYIWNIINTINADLVFSYEVSPMTQVLIGCKYAKKHKIPHFVYIQDLWPENVVTVTGMSNPIVIKPIDKMVDYIYKQADKIFVTSPSFVDAIANRNIPVNRNKIVYWPQYAEDFYVPMEKQSIFKIPDDESFKIAFTGNIGRAQGLDILPKTAKLLDKENVKFVIVGDGRYQEEFEQKIKDLDVIDKFIMIPRQPANMIPSILSACDAGFISFSDTPLWEMTIPAKLQSYMACGKPIIASASGETKRIIEEANCGVCVSLGNAEELANAIKHFRLEQLDVYGDNARNYLNKHFEKSTLLNIMEMLIEEA